MQGQFQPFSAAARLNAYSCETVNVRLVFSNFHAGKILHDRIRLEGINNRPAEHLAAARAVADDVYRRPPVIGIK